MAYFGLSTDTQMVSEERDRREKNKHQNKQKFLCIQTHINVFLFIICRESELYMYVLY